MTVAKGLMRMLMLMLSTMTTIRDYHQRTIQIMAVTAAVVVVVVVILLSVAHRHLDEQASEVLHSIRHPFFI
jgi:type VI protein secretion system component VasF